MRKIVVCSVIGAAALAVAASAAAANYEGKPYPEGKAPGSRASLPAKPWASQRIAFPSLTIIYVGSGVRDDGGGSDAGIATSFNCSNVSGASAQVRFLVLGINGGLEGQVTFTLAHGATRTASTHPEATFSSDFFLNTGSVNQGLVNIESTQSGVFCNAMITNAAVGGNGITLPLVRLNAHPGTQE